MPFPEEAIWDLINDGWGRMSFKQRNLSAAIKRKPEEWELKAMVDVGLWQILVSAWCATTTMRARVQGLEEAVQAQLDLISSGVPSEPTLPAARSLTSCPDGKPTAVTSFASDPE